MKIYSSKYSNQFDKYAGKDIWVKVRSNNHSNYFYIKVLYTEGDNVVCNSALSDYIESSIINDVSIKWEDLVNYLSTKYTFYIPDLTIVHPVQAFTYEELIEEISANYTIDYT